MATKAQQAERAEAIETLREYLKPGDTVNTTTLHTSRSGMSRSIKPTIVYKGEVRDLSYLVALATVSRHDRDRGGVIVTGCGMDMGFHLVYGLSRTLWPDGHPCTGDRSCHSNDHSNDYSVSIRLAKEELPDWNDRPWQDVRARAEAIRYRDGLDYRAGRQHTDGGYALSQRWL